MNTKRNLSFFIVLLMSLVVLSLSAFAASDVVQIDGAKVEALPGETVNVEVAVNDNPGFAYLQLEVIYDTNELELVSVSNGEIAQDMVFGKYIVLSSDNNRTQSGKLVDLSFKVKDTATAGSKTIEINCMECSNYDENDVPVNVTCGQIDVYTTILYTEASKNLVYRGKQFTYDVSLAGIYDGYSIMIPKFGDGYVVESVVPASANILVEDTTSTDIVIDDDYEPDVYLVSIIGGVMNTTYDKDMLVTVTVKVNDDAQKGIREFSLPFIAVSDELGDKITDVRTVYAKVKFTDRHRGDINCDGVFDYYDVSKLFAYYRNKTTIDLEEVDPDINGDGEFNYYDVSKIFAIYRGKADFE